MMCITLSSCDKPAEPTYDKLIEAKSAILLYAVASNNLESNYISDITEIKTAAENLDLDKNAIYVYRVLNESTPTLYRLVKKEGVLTWIKLKEYDRKQFSTDPVRMREVMLSLKNYVKTDNLGLILWSHGSGWIPDFRTHDTSELYPEASAPRKATHYSFGYDSNQDTYDSIDIDELADAIPDGMFKYIWFDCCYMAAIENIYQLRNKADFIVSYPTEVWGDGMPYDLTLPYMLADEPNLVAAADQLFSYYNSRSLAVTVSIVDTSKLEALAEETKKVIEKYAYPGVKGLHDYGRFKQRQFYDFGQYIRMRGEQEPEWSSSDFDTALSNCVIYGRHSYRDFSNIIIRPENYSGLTIHPYEMTSGAQATFYESLDWHQATSK